MAYYTGRALQLIAMFELAHALYQGFALGDEKAETAHLLLGGALFLVGRLIEKRFART